MRWRPLLWLTVSLLCFIGAAYFWRLGDRWAAKNHPATGPAETRPAASNVPTHVAPTQPLRLLSQAGTLNHAVTDARPAPTNATSRFAYRLTNSVSTVGQLAHNRRAILLENALLDTGRPTDLPIPEHLRSKGDPGTYIVQSRSDVDNAFREALKNAGATIVSYIPNNAFLVRASGAAVGQLKASPGTQAVLPYEPYYKLKANLLKLAVEGKPLAANSSLNVLLFGDSREATLSQLQDLGVKVLSEDRTPFGPVVKVQPPLNSLAAVAGLSGVQVVETASDRILANDLSRDRLEISTDTQVTDSYLGLTGTNVLVNINDTGVDTNHPDFTGRIYLDPADTFSLGGTDTDGHGTHVAGVIAGDGTESPTVTNASGSIMPAVGGQFRGKAPGARLFSMPLWWEDSYLQETAAKTNAFISNNSWTYGAHGYSIAAASFDAAVRDALPMETGSHPMVFVFPTGNAGNLNTYPAGSDDGTGGSSDSILSPGTAKNVITVGAVEQPRNITNETWKCTQGQCFTNTPWVGMTDSSNQVAGFSGRGNVGIGVEGDFGRYKPDVVAPGTFVVSTRSTIWDEEAYYNPTSHLYYAYPDMILSPDQTFGNAQYLPENAVHMTIGIYPNGASRMPFPNLPIYMRQTDYPTPTTYDFVRTNFVDMPPDGGANLIRLDNWYYLVQNTSTQAVTFDLLVDVTVTNQLGNYLEVLSNLNNSITLGTPHYYRYESGSSMAAASVSGTLALMQEFFEQRMGVTNSPAMMKALLINGARGFNSQYDLDVNGGINYQGWGLVRLTNSLPMALTTNLTASKSSMFLMDQSPTEALATGQSKTRYFSLTPIARTQPLRVTLVWTDPPGNPAAGIKLVNDLDLIVTNLDSGAVFYGNDITGGNEFNVAWDTNMVASIDVVNNVENVYLSPNLGTNYSITVVGRHVNVNAVYAHTNDVVQDYALVVSSGDGRYSDALTLTSTGPLVSTTTPLVTIVTNSYASSSTYYGGTVAKQHVGANTPLLGTNTILLPTEVNGIMTVGMTNQWHFYLITNAMAYTNGLFATFLPPDLALPRMGVTNYGNPDNATRPQADIDMYVSTDPGLTNLDPNALDAAYKSLKRGGTEVIILSNAVPGLYYIGVKSEDQMAAEYSFMALFSLHPFSQEDQNGVQVFFPPLVPIPDGTPDKPGIMSIMGVVPQEILVRRVIASNIITHELMGDLQGTLTHDSDKNFAVLNNHSPNNGVTNQLYMYDDSGDDDVPGAFPSQGPGSLHDFAGRQSGTLWTFTEVDNAYNHIGTEVYFTIYLEKQQPLDKGLIITIQPHHCKEEFVQVPANVTNMTLLIAYQKGTGPLGVQICPLDDPINCTSNLVAAPGGTVSLDTADNPPLQQGTYRVRLCNLGDDPLTIYIKAFFYYNLAQPIAVSINSTTNTLINDDAVTYAYLTNFNHLTISSLSVGMLISDPRISDLAIRLISPNGTRVLLFENRGALSTNGLGTFSSITGASGIPGFGVTNMTPFYTNGFEQAGVGTYAPGGQFQGWSVLTNFVYVLPDLSAPWLTNNILVLGDGVVSNSLPTTNSTAYELSYRVNHAPYLVGMVSWWPFDGGGADIFGGLDGILSGDVDFLSRTGMVNQAFYGDGSGTRMMVPRCPDLDVGQRRGFSIEGWINPYNTFTNRTPVLGTPVLSNSFENPLSINVAAPAYIADGWHVDTGDVDLFAPSVYGGTAPGDSGNQLIDINGWGPGSISTNITLRVGTRYVLSLAYTRNPVSQNWPAIVPRAAVNVGGLSLLTLAPAVTNSWNNLNWQHTSVVFTVTAPANTVQIRALTPTSTGVLFDSFAITPLDTDTNLYSAPLPILEWHDPFATNGMGQGVQFWYSGLPGTNGGLGSLWANIVDTNAQSHIVSTAPNALTNGGWQHVALTYDAYTRSAQLYTNGMPVFPARVVVAPTNFVPATTGDLWFGYHPAGLTNFVTYAGGLDEFSLFERPLSDCEVQAIFRAATNGKYGTNVLICPVTNSVQLLTSAGTYTFNFTNGYSWWTNGPSWETNTISFTNLLQAAFTNGPGTNITGIIVSPLYNDPNVAVDEFVLSALVTNFVSGLLHFTEDTNLALVPIKFAPAPYVMSNFPPTLVFSNDFEVVTQGVFAAGSTILGSTNDPAIGARDWTVINSPVTVLSNASFGTLETNFVALANGGLRCTLPTSPGRRYELNYQVRGPGAVSWWTGDVEPYSQHAWDVISGNNGSFIDYAWGAAGGFVGQGLYFNGRDTNGMGSKVEVGDPPTLALTNGLTIEGWIRPIVQTNYYGTEQLLFRGDLRDCLDPYYLALEPFGDAYRDLHFHIEGEDSSTCGVDLFTTNAPIDVGRWQHVTAVFERDVVLTNSTATTNELRLYVGTNCVAQRYTGLAPFRDLQPSFSPGITLGNRSRTDYSQPYRGYMDEMSVYGRALTFPEIEAIVNAGAVGKADRSVPAQQSLAKVAVSLDGVVLETAYGENGKWTSRTLVFTASRTNQVLEFQSLEPGTMLDGITLTEVPAELNYLPEESLSTLDGEDAYGVWTLEIWDTRTGVAPTNDLPSLLAWQLNFVLNPSNPPPVVHLVHGMPYTNTLPAFSTQNFVVDVPQWALFATNILEFSTYRYSATPLPVAVLFDLTNQAPSSFSNAVFWPPVSSGVATLSTDTNTSPYIIPGQPYYLTITNPNPYSITFGYGVWYDIMTLTNCEATTNFVGPAGIPKYFQFDVPTNDVPPNIPQEALFWLSGAQSNLSVVLSQHLPLPDMRNYDYISRQPSTNDEIFIVLTNSTPYPIQSNRWYIGVFNLAATNVPFTVQACYNTNAFPVLIPLTNTIPYVAGPAHPYVAPPGPPRWFFFRFDIPNYTDAVLFELYDLSGDVDLVLQRDVPPGMAPYYAGSFRSGTSPEQIVLRTGPDVADLRGSWYLGVYNNEATNVAYTIRAALQQGGMLLSGKPVAFLGGPVMRPTPGGLFLQWNAVEGEYYLIEFSPVMRLNPPWQPWGVIQATTPLATFEDLVNTAGTGFYRLSQVSSFNMPSPQLTIQYVPARNALRISWPVAFPNETLQYSTALSGNGPWFNVNQPVTIEGNEYVVYDPLGPTTRYYRLIP